MRLRNFRAAAVAAVAMAAEALATTSTIEAPCICEDVWEPVCCKAGNSGNQVTFSSLCVARCSEFCAESEDKTVTNGMCGSVPATEPAAREAEASGSGSGSGAAEAASLGPEGYFHHANGIMCDGNHNKATYFGPWGDVTLEDCLDGCHGASDCNYVTYTKQGYCRYWYGCDQTKEKEYAMIFQKDPDYVHEEGAAAGDAFELDEDGKICDDQQASERGMWGKGNSLRQCEAACRDVGDCSFFSLTNTGYCRFWAKCDTRRNKNAQIWRRAGVEAGSSSGGEVNGYTVTHTDEMCTGDAASTRGKWGSGHSAQACLEACDEVNDCNFASVNDKGFCRFWRTCDSRSSKQGTTVYEKPAPAGGAEGGAEGGATFTLHLSKKMCGAGRLNSPSGSGHSLQSCKDACAADGACNFITYTNNGWCRLWSECGSPFDKGNTDVWAKNGAGAGEGGSEARSSDEFTDFGTDFLCNRPASSRGLWGHGHSAEACKLECSNVEDCRYATLTATGYCRLWQRCDEPEAKVGAVAFERVVEEDGAEAGNIAGFTLVGHDLWCDDNDDGVKASNPGPWAQGHDAASCQQGCTGDCQYVTLSSKGHCRYWSVCGTQGTKSGARLFSRDAPASLMASMGVSTKSAGTFAVATVTVGAVLAVGVAAYRRFRGAGAPRTGSPMEATPLVEVSF